CWAPCLHARPRALPPTSSSRAWSTPFPRENAARAVPCARRARFQRASVVEPLRDDEAVRRAGARIALRAREPLDEVETEAAELPVREARRHVGIGGDERVERIAVVDELDRHGVPPRDDLEVDRVLAAVAPAELHLVREDLVEDDEDVGRRLLRDAEAGQERADRLGRLLDA